jgi:REP element-mobilizing transposase RayT
LSSFRYDTVESLSDALSTFLSSKLKNHSAIFESLASSKNWLEALGDFSSIEIESTKAKDNSLHLLWTNREDSEVVQFIEARIRLISLALNRINPLYYNATQSLALTYQKILDGVEEWELLYYFSDFLGELDKANAVSMEINRQLQLERP